MSTGIQEWYFRNAGSSFNPHVIYADHPSVFSMKVFHGGTFTPSPNRKYFGGKVQYVDLLDIEWFTIDIIHNIVKMLKYDPRDIMFYHFKIPNKWLKKNPAENWSRSHFTGRAHCDLLINNICEVFNRQLLEARDSLVVSALEYVREYLMKRIVVVQKVIEKSDGPLTPSVTKVFKKIKEASAKYIVDWNGDELIQVKGPYGDQCVVNLKQKVCSCRKWEVSGLPCKHAVAAIHNMAKNGMNVGLPEAWVHPSYRLDTWKQQYSFKVNPISGRNFWELKQWPTTLLPPKIPPQIGRPSKKRKKSAIEIEEMVKGGKLSKKGQSVTCFNCKQKGHNKRGCKNVAATTQRQPQRHKMTKKTGNVAATTQRQPQTQKMTKKTANRLTPTK